MPIDLVIFDCDGVLVDSEPIGVQVDLQVLSEFGLQMTEEEVIRRFVGASSNVIAETIEHHLGRSLPSTWLEDYQQRRHAAYDSSLKPVANVEFALDRIARPTCVASSSSLSSIRHKLSLTGLLERFAGRIFSADDVADGKPCPDLFLHAARRLGVQPGRCAVVEDSVYGVEAAQRAGMYVLAYVGGSVAQNVPADIPTFCDMCDLPDLLEQCATPI
jgi:HAD superfamily hydrolase (TIGR01509 family)